MQKKEEEAAKKKKKEEEAAMKIKENELKKAREEKKRQREKEDERRNVRKEKNMDTVKKYYVDDSDTQSMSSASEALMATSSLVVDGPTVTFTVPVEQFGKFITSSSKKPRKRASTSAIDTINDDVKRCRVLGYRVANRNGTGRDSKYLCPACGNMYANLGTHLPSHKDLDKDRIATYAKGQFTRGMRGPFHLPTLREKVLACGSDPGKVDAMLLDVLSMVGVGLTDNASKALPLYERQNCFQPDWVIPDDPVNAISARGTHNNLANRDKSNRF
ncbi:Fimbrial protein 987P [Frankliniella fusca]|uniref:Fimbrial protein 987P n=1 Tax=Frankliniella fusca TaxID=407009 RepID=A0AAE1HV77_9NEOP|nr:Fimbrial protein 987P [Frankliniella fusca]